jgi:hypothetical protein
MRASSEDQYDCPPDPQLTSDGAEFQEEHRDYLEERQRVDLNNVS